MQAVVDVLVTVVSHVLVVVKLVAPVVAEEAVVVQAVDGPSQFAEITKLLDLIEDRQLLIIQK